MSSPQTTQTTSDFQAIVDALRRHERFLLITHENPDGDALGSILAAKLVLTALGKDAVMYLSGQAPLPAEYKFMPLDELRRELPDDVGERVLFALDCANESRLGEGQAALEPRSPRAQRRPPPRQLAVRGREPRARRRLVDRRDRPRPRPRARRRADAGAGRGALRRPRHRHRPLPVREHDPEGPAARRRARRSGGECPPRLPERLRDRAAREAEAPRAGPGARAGLRGRWARRLATCSRPTSRRSGPPSRTRRGSSTSFAPSRAPRWRR